MQASGPTQPSAEVVERAETLIYRVPQSDENWDHVLRSLHEVEQLRGRLILDVSPSDSLHAIFQASSGRKSRATANEVGFLEILALGTGLVLLRDAEGRSSRCSAEREAVIKRFLQESSDAALPTHLAPSLLTRQYRNT